uniref:UV-stimulated scaffold protein A n=1 Tax=Labrus bergylta TaxID=56723 RepID=A0A3Q3GF57_9LABR
MELSQRDRLSVLVEELTTSGQPQLNQDKMKEIKKICKYRLMTASTTFITMMSQLSQEHAEVRLSAFQIATSPLSLLFLHVLHVLFNGLLPMQEFLELTVETDLEQPLPPPKEVARKLRALAIQTKLALGYHFLKQVDFQDAEARTVAERRREEERQRKMARIYKERVEAASKDMEESQQEIEATLTEMESCMRLLLPEFDLAGIQGANSPQKSQPANECEEEPCCSKDLKDDRRDGAMKEMEEKDEEDEQESLDGDSFIRNSGLISHSYSLDLNLSTGLHLKETEDNEAVVSTSWVQVFTKAGAEQQMLRRALDLKSSLEASLQKHKELHIDYKTRVRKVDEDDDDDDDDFDEVPEKEGYEPHIPEHLRAAYGLDPSPSTSTAAFTKKPPPKRPAPPPTPLPSSSRRLKRLTEEEQDPTCAAATLRHLRQNLPLPPAEPSSSVSSPSQTGSGQAADAPVVPFGLDLYYWGEEQPNAGKIVKSTSQHQFWVHAEVNEEVQNEELLAESKSRYISFPGSFTPVSHHCRAPLGEGRLCQRQDRRKCPFHGPIVPRDQDGRPCRKEDRLREEKEERKKREEQPDWRDAELMRDIEAATGENLGSDRVGKKGKGKKKKYPNLSDLKQNANTARSRLERKVFNKSSMRRVAQVMSKADGRKHDKFSNQFNYALN